MEALQNFLSNKRYEKGVQDDLTHTIYDSNSGVKGSYYIEKNLLPQLYDIIGDIRTNGGNVSLLERVSSISPFVIDLDFKYKNDIKSRQYTDDFIKQLSIYLLKKIKELYDLTADNQSNVWVMEKPNISICEKVPYVKKDGIHLIFPDIIAETKTYIKLMENIIQDKESIESIFKDYCISSPSNDIKDIFDTHIYKNGNWFIYGSGKPNDIIYELTKIYKINENNVEKIPVELYLTNPREILNKCSVQLNTDINVIYKGPEILKRKTPIKTVSSQIDLLEIEDMNNYRKIKGIELDYINKLCNILSQERASEHKTWIDVGYCLHSISPKHLLNSWINFSKKWIGYIDSKECEEKWDYMNSTNTDPEYTIGTLIFWAKQDNPEAFDILKKDSLKTIIEKSLVGEKSCGSHSDVANVVYNYYKDLYVCSSLKDDLWHYFNEYTGRWKETEKGHELRIKLSWDIVNLYEYYGGIYKEQCKSLDPETDDMYQIYDRRHTNCCKIVIKLKDGGYKDRILKECKEKFYDAEFMTKLNSKKNLLGFDNGVIDLKYEYLKHDGTFQKEIIFRQGRPDDYISLSVGYPLPVERIDKPTSIDIIGENIKNINDYDTLDADLEDFIIKVLPKEDVREYTLRFLASCLSGEIREEKFYFWTGSGANGKSKITDLITATLGEYSKTMDVSYLTTKRGSSSSASPELEAIRFARFVSMSEPEKDDSIYVGKLKQITGGDTMTSRALFKNTTEFKPQFKLMLMCNDLPKLAGNDGGVARRIEVVDFISKFTDNPKPSDHNPHQYKADLELGTKLKRWNLLFIIKLLSYYTIYDKEGTKAPPSVTEATKCYMIDNDIIQKWMTSSLEITEIGEDPTPLDDLEENLKSWCEDEGYDFKQIKKPDLKKTLIKENEKTKHGYPSFGKKLSDGMPNGTLRNPKFNFKPIEDQ